MKLLVEAPLNSLSFGNVSYNLLREFKALGVDVGLFPTSKVDLAAFKVPKDLEDWLSSCVANRWEILKSKAPSLRLWHLMGGEDRKSSKQNLLTFYECSDPTAVEVSVCKSQNRTLLSSSYSLKKFEDAGCDNCSFVPMGFDKDFFETGKKYLDGVVHFGLMGKFEKRKHTEAIIKTWLKKYGNDNNYQLSCCVTNPFFKPEQMQNIVQNLLGGKRYTNINFLPYLSTNEEVNEFLNAIDIDLTGLSLAEGWNLPSFNATCLGKWSIVGNHTAHKDWANSENCILVEPDGKIPVHDGFFFLEGSEYNQGFFYSYEEDTIVSAMEDSVKKLTSNKINTNGLKLKDIFSYSNTAKIILDSFQ